MLFRTMASETFCSDRLVLGTTNLYNGMILSSIKFHGFTFGFPKMPHTNGDVFLTYKFVIILLISQRGTRSQQLFDLKFPIMFFLFAPFL